MGILRIVLTGGPSAGKSSIIKSLSQHKFNVDNVFFLFASETATELMSSNIKVSDIFSEYDFQTQVFQVQIAKENYYVNIAKQYLSDKNVIIVYDRGVLDGIVYIDETNGRKIFSTANLALENAHTRYDVVIHLESAAKNKGYTTENNSTRRETENEAIEVEEKTLSLNRKYVPEDKLFVVQATDVFADKVSSTIEIIEKLLEEQYIANKK